MPSVTYYKKCPKCEGILEFDLECLPLDTKPILVVTSCICKKRVPYNKLMEPTADDELMFMKALTGDGVGLTTKRSHYRIPLSALRPIEELKKETEKSQIKKRLLAAN